MATANLQPRRQEVLIATLGIMPAVITTALDLLLQDGRPITELVVIHTCPQDDAAGTASDAAQTGRPAAHQDNETAPGAGSPQTPADTLAAPIQRLEHALEHPPKSHTPAAYAKLTFRRVPLVVDGEHIPDIRTAHEARAAFRNIYREVQDYKKQGFVVHFSIAGGRKSMSVYGMAVAQLLFDAHDRLWHVLSSPSFVDSGEMHPRRGEADLVEIPVLSMGLCHIGHIGALLVTGDPVAAITEQRGQLSESQKQRRRKFLENELNAGERQLVKCLVREVVAHRYAPTNQQLARRLVVAESTVRNRLSEIYSKMRYHFEIHGRPVEDKSLIVGLYAPYFDELIG